MVNLSVFGYEDPRRFLVDHLNYRRSYKANLSVRSWSEELGFSSHSTLVRILQGKRPLKIQHVPLISKGLKLMPNEQLYFQTLVQLKNAVTLGEKKYYRELLSRLSPKAPPRFSEIGKDLKIDHWIYPTLLAMTDLKDFDPDPNVIKERLNRKVSVRQIKTALDALISSGLLTNVEGKLVATHTYTTSKTDVPNEDIRNCHKLLLGVAAKAIDTVPIEQREYQAYSVAISNKKVDLAKRLIQRFLKKFIQVVAADESEPDEVFQLQVQFYPMSKKISKRSKGK